MRILRKTADLKSCESPLVLAAGTFDGIHIGHQKVISLAIEVAKSCAAEAWVLTFEPHPKKTLENNTQPLLLTSLAHKLRLIEDMGVDGCALLHFDRKLQNQTPAEFVSELSSSIPHLSEIVVGANWSFGKGGAGDVALLDTLGERFGFKVTIVSPVICGGEPVSSTRIRQAVSRGDLDLARDLLGRPFSVLGTVVPGRKIGRKLGYPTANIVAEGEIEPPPGIYAVYALINGRRHEGVAYYGSRPTFTDESHELLLEVHIFDGSFDLYSSEMEIVFMKFIREDLQFASQEKLVETIKSDCRQARRILSESRSDTTFIYL